MTAIDPFAVVDAPEVSIGSVETNAETNADPNPPEPAERTSSQRYTAAEKRLRENHQAEFLALLEEEYAMDGLRYQRRLTPEEKAARARAERKARLEAEIAERLARLEALDQPDTP